MQCSAYETVNTIDPFDFPNQCESGPITCVLLYTPNLLGILGTFFVILSYCQIESLRSYPTMKYLIHVCAMEFLTSVGPFYYFADSIYYNSTVGKCIASFLVYAGFVAMIWILLMALEFKRVAFNYGFSASQQVKAPGAREFFVYKLVAYTLPVFPVVIPLLLGESAFAFIATELSVVSMLLMLSTFITYIRCALQLSQMQQSLTKIDAFRDLLIYPLILAVCWTQFALVNLIMSYSSICQNQNDDIPNGFAAWILVAEGTLRFQGFFNACAYLRTRSIWKQIKTFYFRKDLSISSSVLRDVNLETNLSINEY